MSGFNKRPVLLLIDPATLTNNVEAVQCIKKIINELSAFSQFPFSEVEYLAPFLEKITLKKYLSKLNRKGKVVAAVIGLGSFANVTEKLSFVEKLAFDLKENIINKQIPFFGICFSHQLLAYMNGIKVSFLKNRHNVQYGKHHIFREFDILHPKIALLATKLKQEDYFSYNGIDLSFRESVEFTINWGKREWQYIQSFPCWKLTQQEHRIRLHVEKNTEKKIISHARHEQEVWDIPKDSSLIELGGQSNLCQVEALVYATHPIYTLQTHPETEHNSGGGYLILKNFLYMSAIFFTKSNVKN